MNSTTALNTVYMKGAAEYLDVNLRWSWLYTIWNKFPEKQSWMPNQYYELKPITDDI